MISSKKLTTLFELFELVVLKNSLPIRDVLSWEEESVWILLLREVLSATVNLL